MKKQQNMSQPDDSPEQDESTIMDPIAAGKDRVKWMVSNFRSDPNIGSWRITMDFDTSGELISYWEGSLDGKGHELIGGGIERAPAQAVQLSDVQIDVLLLGLNHKLDRSSMGWSYDDRVNWSDPVRIYSPATIRSLWNRGLLVGNFDDSRGVGSRSELAGLENLDGARHAHSPEVLKFQVWTSELGREVLRELSLLEEDPKTLH